MEKLIVEEICKSCYWYEKIIVKIFSHTFIKVYHKMRIAVVNRVLE